MKTSLLEFDGNQTERKVEDLSQTAMALVALLLKNSEGIGYKPSAKGVLLRWIQICSIKVSYSAKSPILLSILGFGGTWKRHGVGLLSFLDIFLGDMLPENEIQDGTKDFIGLGNKTSSAALPLTFSHLKEKFSQVCGDKSNCRDISNRS